jgi:hypothetical protein
MGGGLMQLVAYGAQDVYLTSNPQITFFKVVYRRHTNFSMESIEQTLNGNANFGSKVSCTISRNGDLIHRVYLQVTLPKVELQESDGSGTEFRWLNWVGHRLVKSIELEIGGQKIDKQYGDWLHIWNELTQPAGKQAGYAQMVGNVPELTNLLTHSGVGCDDDCAAGEPNASSETRKCAPQYTLYIPLQFWFCRNPGLVAASFWVDYIYLDTEERRRMAQLTHEYLIEQLQFTGDESITSSSNKIRLNFNHPVKELVWVVQRDSFVSCDETIVDAWKGQQPFNYSDWWDRSTTGSMNAKAATSTWYNHTNTTLTCPP